MKATGHSGIPSAGPKLPGIILVLLMLAAIGIDLAAGSGGFAPADAAWMELFTSFRLPRVMAAAASGAALALVGLLMQTLLANPLAGPSVLGLEAGSSLAVAVWVLLPGVSSVGAGLFSGALAGRVASAVLGSAAVLLFLLWLHRRLRDHRTLLIVGVVFSSAIHAGITLLLHFARPAAVQQYLSWTFASFSAAGDWQLWLLAALTVFSVAASRAVAAWLDTLPLGHSRALSLGVPVRQVQALVLVCCALLAGLVTAICGPVSFLGLAAPHAARFVLRTSRHRSLAPASAAIGVIVACSADAIANAIPGTVLPVNSLTPLFGVPVLLAVLLGRHNREVQNA